MREGTVVMVVGKMDTRIIDAPEGPVYGTVISLHQDEVAVLLSNGNIWRGHKRDVVIE